MTGTLTPVFAALFALTSSRADERGVAPARLHPVAAMTRDGQRVRAPFDPSLASPALEEVAFVGSRPALGSRIIVGEDEEALTVLLAVVPQRSTRVLVTAEISAAGQEKACLANRAAFWLVEGRPETLAMPILIDPSAGCAPPFTTVALTVCTGAGAARTCRSFPARYTFVR